MASTVSAANLKVKITEEVILNGKDQGGTTELTIASIKDVSKRIVTIAADDDATVLVFKSTTASADNALDKDTVKYIRITNLDDSNSVNISLQLDSVVLSSIFSRPFVLNRSIITMYFIKFFYQFIPLFFIFRILRSIPFASEFV